MEAYFSSFAFRLSVHLHSAFMFMCSSKQGLNDVLTRESLSKLLQEKEQTASTLFQTHLQQAPFSTDFKQFVTQYVRVYRLPVPSWETWTETEWCAWAFEECLCLYMINPLYFCGNKDYEDRTPGIEACAHVVWRLVEHTIPWQELSLNASVTPVVTAPPLPTESVMSIPSLSLRPETTTIDQGDHTYRSRASTLSLSSFVKDQNKHVRPPSQSQFSQEQRHTKDSPYKNHKKRRQKKKSSSSSASSVASHDSFVSSASSASLHSYRRDPETLSIASSISTSRKR